MRHLVLTALVFFVTVGSIGAQDWPQWRGANRDDISSATNLLKSWPEEGPKQLWANKESGLGYAGFAIVGDRLYTMGLEDEETFAICLNADTGKQIWKTTIGPRYNNGWGDGPRSTPTVDGDDVFVLASKGNLCRLNAKDGKLVWTKSLTTDFGGSVPYWGYSESPLVDGEMVLASPGSTEKGTVVALNRKDGSLIWQSGEVKEKAHYSSIIKVESGMKKQYVQLTPKKLFGLDDKGKLVWESDWHGQTAVIPTPIHHENHVYISSGYNAGCKLVDISGEEAKDVWQNREMKNHHGGVILYKGHLYGYSDKRGWVCQNWETGEVAWFEKRAFKKGAIGFADGHFYCLEENTGKVALIEATEKGWNLVSEFQMEPRSTRRKRSGKIWVHPTIANGKLYLRDQEIILCYDISGKPSKSEK